MTIDEILRETAPDHDRLRAHTDLLRADVLARTTARRPRRVRRPVRTAIAAATVATVGMGGVAYAAGAVPAPISSIVDDFGRQFGIAPGQRPEMTQVVDLALPDDSRFAAWRGVSAAMECTAYTDNWDGVEQLGSGGAACSDGPLQGVSVVWARSADHTVYYPVLFGDTASGASQVRVTGTFRETGERVDATWPVDPVTHEFAGVLPGTSTDPWAGLAGSEPPVDSDLTLRFLDDTGSVLTTLDDVLY